MPNGHPAARDRHLRTLFADGAIGQLSDGQLLERFATRGGDPAELAFAALVERHGPMVLRVARSVLREEHAAHDAFQATFLILARKARALWVRDSIGPWLHAVASRVASDHRAAEARRRRHERDSATREGYHSREPDQRDLALAIHEEIARLPERYRPAIVLCHLEGLTQHEAAHRLGWPVGTLQSRLARGRDRLRERLGRRGLAPGMAFGTFPASPPPDALVLATVRAASALSARGPIAGMIGPAVLAMIDATSKGMLMTKLKLGAMALAVVGGVVASTAAPGFWHKATATQEVARTPEGEARPTSPSTAGGTEAIPPPAEGTDTPDLVEFFESQSVAGLKSQPSPTTPEGSDTIPPPADGPGFPYLLEFFETQTVAGLKSHQEVASLIRAGYPMKSYDVTIYSNQTDSPGRAMAEQYKVQGYPTVLMVDGTGKEIARIGALEGPSKIAAFYNHMRKDATGGFHGAAKEQGFGTIPEEPTLDYRELPKPWETVVRIKVHLSEKEWGFGSGTVIKSTPQESIILTCGHIFRVKGQAQPAPVHFRTPITVDLFNGQFVSRNPAMINCSVKDLPGEAIDYDFTNDVGLIRIKPGRAIAASRVVPPDWAPRRGMKMISLGCSHGQDATAWDTTILDPRVAMSNGTTRQGFAMIKCANQPKEGRAGGGLFTTDGYVAGVCDFADPNEQVGLYATPASIHGLLDRNGLADVYRREVPDNSAFPMELPVPEERRVPELSELPREQEHYLSPSEPPSRDKVSEQGRRLDEVERKLDRIIEALQIDSLRGVKGDFDGPPPQRKR